MILAPSLIAYFFRYQIFCRIQKVSSTKFLGTVRQNVLKEKRDNPSFPPSLLSTNFFDTRTFVDHRRVALPRLSLLWHNKVSVENRDITFSSRKFWIPEFSHALWGTPTKFFGTVRQQTFYRKS